MRINKREEAHMKFLEKALDDIRKYLVENKPVKAAKAFERARENYRHLWDRPVYVDD